MPDQEPSDIPEDVATAPQRVPSTGWGAAIVHLASGVTSILSRNERRQIQTMRYDRWDNGLVWQCLHSFVLPHLPDLGANKDQIDANEQRWACLIIGMSWCDHSRAEHALRFGSALGLTKYQEPRVISLLRCEAHDEALYDRFIHAVRFVGQKNTALDWRDASRVLFTFDAMKRERLRRDIARDYYRERPLDR